MPGVTRIAFNVPDIIIEWIGVEIAVDAGNGDHHRISGSFFILPEQDPIQYCSTFCGDIQLKHHCMITS